MKRQSGGTPWIGILMMILAVMKLNGNLDWSWWIVLSPMIFLIGLLVVLGFVQVVLNHSYISGR